MSDDDGIKKGFFRKKRIEFYFRLDIPPLEDIPVNTTTTKQTSKPVVKYVETQSKGIVE
jgi:hypothetical protein